MKNIQRTLILGCSLVALAGCGADEIVSPGTSGNITVNINNPPPAPTPTPTPTQTGVTPAAGCPTINSAGGLRDDGTLPGPTGTYRVCTLPGVITQDDTLPFIRGLVYNLGGQVFVGPDRGFARPAAPAVETPTILTIQPGVIIYGQGSAALIVRRGNRLVSNGSADRPIIWTSRDNIIGLANEESQQQWGGVVLLGRARVSDCATGGVNTDETFAQNPTCQQNLEGAATTIPYGGNLDTDNSGSFTFNQIRFSGFELAPGNELQSLTTGGAGSGTVITNMQTYNSSDDGLEVFGGSVNMRNIAVIGASDDGLDVDTGAQANFDSVIVAQRASTGDSTIELDSPNSVGNPIPARPITRMRVNNFTFVERSTISTQVVRARGGAALSLTNGVIDKINGTTTFCFRIDESETLAALIGVNSVVCDGGAANGARGDRGSGANATTDAAVLAAITAAANTNVNLNFTITLTGGVVNGANETGVTAFDATARSSFFPVRTFIGAVQNAAGLATFRNWTCNSGTLDFGSSLGACTSLPIFT